MATTRRQDALRETLEGFAQYLRTSSDFQPVTKRTYAREARNFLRDTGVGSIAALSPTILQAWHAAMVDRSLSASTIQQRHAAVRQFLIWLNRFQGRPRASALLQALLLLKAPRAQGVKQPTTPLSPAEIERILEVGTTAGDFYGPRVRAMVHLLVDTGLRATEVAELKLADIDLEERTARVWGKGGKERTVVYTKECGQDLARWREERGRYRVVDNTLFVSGRGRALHGADVWQIVKVACKSAGIERRIWTHLFRYTRITTLLQRGMPIQDVADLAGQVNINTTKRYSIPETQNIKAQYDQYA